MSGNGAAVEVSSGHAGKVPSRYGVFRYGSSGMLSQVMFQFVLERLVLAVMFRLVWVRKGMVRSVPARQSWSVTFWKV